MKATLTQNGRINIPKKILSQLNIDSHEEVYIYIDGNQIIITKHYLSDEESIAINPTRILYMSKNRTLRLSLDLLKSIGLKSNYEVSIDNQCIKVS